jgi:sulfur carrier protein
VSNPAQRTSVTVTVNGEMTEIPAGLTIAGLLAHLQVISDRVAVELDRQIVRKGEWESRVVQPGAALEIVTFVGGG